jgi:streptogramin lyase
MLCVVTAIGIAAAAAPAAQAAAITDFSTGLSVAPGAITPGLDGNLWFTEPHALGRITTSGAITEFGTAHGLSAGSEVFGDITVGSDGNLWFSDDGTPKALGRITPSGTITEFKTGLNPGSVPENLVLGSDGNVWFIDNGTPKAIGEITPSGAITEHSMGLNPLSQPNDITLGPDGNVWFTDQGGMVPAIGRVTPAGTITEFNPVATGLDPMSFPNEITAGADGNVWFTDDGMPAAIGRVTPDGTVTEFTTGLQTGTMPDSLTAGPDGNVWFADQYANQRAIGRVTPAGTITEFDNGLSMKLPDDITVGADNNLWVTQSDTSPGKVAAARISTAGAITEVPSPTSPSSGDDGDQIVTGPDGNLWFTDVGTPPAIGRVALQIAPTASTGRASAVTNSTAKVSGSVNPLGAATTVTFGYGTTPALGAKLTAGSLAASGTPSAVAGTLSKLPAHTVIYYRASATNVFGTTNGSLQKFTTAAAPAPPAAPTHTTTAQFGNQQLRLTTPPLQTCTAKTATITAMLSSTAIPKSPAVKLRFVSAAFYLDKGLGHPHKKTKRLRNGKHKTVIVVVYTANTVVHHLPATSTLGLDGLHSGSHTLKVKISYHETVTKHQRKSTLTVTKTLSAKFRVC